MAASRHGRVVAERTGVVAQRGIGGRPGDGEVEQAPERRAAQPHDAHERRRVKGSSNYVRHDRAVVTLRIYRGGRFAEVEMWAGRERGLCGGGNAGGVERQREGGNASGARAAEAVKKCLSEISQTVES